jgi:hypothetical protein
MIELLIVLEQQMGIGGRRFMSRCVRVSRAQGTFEQLLKRDLFVGPCLCRAIHGIIYGLACEMTRRKKTKADK